MTNEFGEIRVQQFVPTTAMEHIEEAMSALSCSLETFGHASPKLLFTDKVNSDKSFFEACFPSLTTEISQRTTVSSDSYAHLPKLNLPDNSSVTMHTSANEINAAMTNLLELADQSDGTFIVGLDAEWTFNRYRPSWTPVSIIQIAYNECNVMIIKLKHQTVLPQALLTFLSRDDIIKAGKNINGDLSRLQQSYRDQPLNVKGQVELGTFCRERGLITSGNSSLAVICAHVLQRHLPKETSVRESNWDGNLSRKQIQYAALDAWASLEIYRRASLVPIVNGETRNPEVIPGSLVTLLSDDTTHRVALGRVLENQPR